MLRLPIKGEALRAVTVGGTLARGNIRPEVEHVSSAILCSVLETPDRYEKTG